MLFEKVVVVFLDLISIFVFIIQFDRFWCWMVVVVCIELCIGGVYCWMVILGYSVVGIVIDVDFGKWVVFIWGWEDYGDFLLGGLMVIIMLILVDGGIEVWLVYDGLIVQQVVWYVKGWNYFLDWLVVVG